MTDSTGRFSGITPSSATPQHQAAGKTYGSARIAVVTISDTRTPETDESGRYLCEVVGQAGHTLAEYLIVHDDAVQIRSTLVRLLREADLILTTGGTGIAGRDVTIGVVESLLVKPIPGFGELFRTLSYEQVRGAAMLSRATGGLTRGALLFALPGSLNAVQTAWEGILKDQIGHLVFEVARQGQPGLNPGMATPGMSQGITQANLPRPEPALPEIVRPDATSADGMPGVTIAETGQVTVIGAAPGTVSATETASLPADPAGLLQSGQNHSGHVNQGAAAGIGRHAGVAASPSSVNSNTPATPALGRHAAGRTDKNEH